MYASFIKKKKIKKKRTKIVSSPAITNLPFHQRK